MPAHVQAHVQAHVPAHVPAHVLARVLAHVPAHVPAHVLACVSCCNRRHVWDPRVPGSQTHDPSETRLRRPQMKNSFFKKRFPILSEKLKLVRKVKGFGPSVTHLFEKLVIRGSV